MKKTAVTTARLEIVKSINQSQRRLQFCPPAGEAGASLKLSLFKKKKFVGFFGIPHRAKKMNTILKADPHLLYVTLPWPLSLYRYGRGAGEEVGGGGCSVIPLYTSWGFSVELA